MKDFAEFEEKVGVSFTDKQLLKKAFTHRSYINENPNVGWRHNERLEFLGDAVIELIITKYLFDKYPNKPEGELTAYRAALVNTVSLASAAREWFMEEYLLLSKGESKDTEGRAREHILANTFEAIVGAMYLDQGYAPAEQFVGRALYHRIDEIIEKGLYKDPKSWVQEKAQEELGVTPTYEVISAEGPDHDKHFRIAIFFGDDKVAVGEGRSKQDAQQSAAKAALDAKGWS